MARLGTCGFEIQTLLSTINQFALVSGSFDNTTRRLGLGTSFLAPALTSAYGALSLSGAHGTDYFLRLYFYPTGGPSGSASPIASFFGVNEYAVRQRTGQFLTAYGDGTKVGIDSPTYSSNEWHLLEVRVRTSASASSSQMECYLDGVQFGTSSTINLTNTLTGANLGIYSTALPTGVDCYFDDFAVNDSSGAAENSWCGEGKVLLLLPTGNNSIGNWKSGTGTSATNDGNQWNAINNTPPTVSSATPIATTQAIGNNVSGASNAGRGDFNMTTYSAAGVPDGSTISLVQMTIAHGEDVTTGAKTGTFTIVSNPALGVDDNVAQGGTNQFGPSASGAVGVWASNWVGQRGTIAYNPSVTLGTAPVGRINKTDTGTRYADLCFMGIVVEYVPPAGFIPHSWVPTLGPILAQ